MASASSQAGELSQRALPWLTPPNRLAHPARMNAVAQLYGAPYESGPFAYLQIGAGDGGHLFGLAAAYPEARFVGVEETASLREDAAQNAERSQLANLSFEDEQFLKRGAAGGFDFVVWLDGFSASAAGERVERLRDCAALLNPNGLGLVGYDVLPGSRCFNVAKEVLGRLAGKAGKAEAGELRAALSTLRDAPAGGRGIELLRPELDALNALDDARLERLVSTPSAPIMFHDFVHALEAASLSYVGEAAYSDTHNSRALAASYPVLASPTDRLERDQYLDIISGRRTRRSLLVRAGRPLTPSVAVDGLRGLSCLSPLRSVSSSAESQVFVAPGGAKVRLSDPLLAALLELLGKRFPEALAFEELAPLVADELGDVPDDATVAAAILAGYERELLDLMSTPPRCTSRVSERPRVSALVRLELDLGRPLTSCLHFPVTLRSALAKALIPLLDGTRALDDLVRDVWTSAPTVEASKLPELVSLELSQLGRQGLLLSA